ncbi:hypothetical protein C8F04DRAFT_1329349 [Mycena alexandri]|uniref:Uncharacterized protein n=1 Tax=Mycena alexandri TaxID=1745969 RepID=A0AAD6RZ24_9AGAR|nr:hypothetical protein C8F04DRAFT_1329349 [Mycena alexandri]
MDGGDLYSYSSSRSSTPAQDLYQTIPGLYMDSGAARSSSSSDDCQWGSGSSTAEPFTPSSFTLNTFRYNNPRHPTTMQRGQIPDFDCSQCVALRRDNLVLKTENDTLLKAYNSLLKAVRPMSYVSEAGLISSALPDPGFSTLIQITPPPNQSDYPLVQFWHRHEFQAFMDKTKGESSIDGPKPRGNSRASQGINVSMRYVSDENGNGSWRQRASLPATWGKAGLDLQRNFSAAICAQYPEMRLCAHDWKVQYMVTTMYSSWRTHRTGVGIKSEAVDDGLPVKRSRNESITDDSTRKRSKIAKTAAHKNINVETETPGSSDVSGPSPVIIVNPLPAVVNPAPTETPDSTAVPAPFPVIIVNPLPALVNPAPTETPDSTAVPAPSPVVIVNPLTAVVNPAPPETPDSTAVPTPPPVIIVNPLAAVLHPPIENSPVPTSTATVDSVPAAPVAAAVPAVVPALGAPPSLVKRSKRSKPKATPGHSRTPRNLCMIDWCTKHPGGDLDDFKLYWGSIEGTADEKVRESGSVLPTSLQRWVDDSKKAINAKSQAAQ